MGLRAQTGGAVGDMTFPVAGLGSAGCFHISNLVALAETDILLMRTSFEGASRCALAKRFPWRKMAYDPAHSLHTDVMNCAFSERRAFQVMLFLCGTP